MAMDARALIIYMDWGGDVNRFIVFPLVCLWRLKVDSKSR